MLALRVRQGGEKSGMETTIHLSPQTVRKFQGANPTMIPKLTHLGNTTSMGGLLILLIGPSGVGKTVLANMLLARHPDWVLGKSATTRVRRPGEGDAFYRFVTEEGFSALEQQGEFLEWATVHNGACYGTLRDAILPALEKGQNVLREIDIQGLESIRHHSLFHRPDGRYHYRAIFLAPESPEQLIAHISQRAPMTDEELQRRLASVKKEMTYAAQCDATIVSREGKIAATADLLEKAILQ